MSADRAKAISTLLTRLKASAEPAPMPEQVPVVAGLAVDDDLFHGDRLLAEFVRSFLIWESATSRGDAAMLRLRRHVVDVNELRVSLAEEIAEILGRELPRADERAMRVKGALHDLFAREHRLRLDFTAQGPEASSAARKTAFNLMASLNQTPRYVAARTALLMLHHPVMPIDGRILTLLRATNFIDDKTGADDAAAIFEKHLEPDALRAAYAIIQGAADAMDAVMIKAGAKRRTRTSTSSKNA
jgi:hypothetical protein